MKIDPQLSALGILGSADDDPPMSEVDDALDKFCAAAALAGAIGGRPGTAFAHIEAFSEETEELDETVASGYRKIAEAAARKQPAATDPQRLDKSANRKRRLVRYGDANDAREVHKRDVTTYSDVQLIAELDAHGRIIRIIEEQGV